MRSLPRGVYTAIPTFFTETEELDMEAFEKHVEYVANAGTIPVPTGTMGEACHLTANERCTLIASTRKILDNSPATKYMPVIAGVGAPSTRETISLAQDAAMAGADFVMVIPPGYYAGLLKADGMQAIKKYFVDVSKASPVPVIAYNFPAVSSGIDMNSELVIDMVKEGGNICGCKFTCANVAKITRITAVLSDPVFQAKYPRHFHQDPSGQGIPYFSAIDGFIDILLASVSARASGAITGISNFIPRCCVKLWRLCEKSRESFLLHEEAQRLQNLISLADGDVQGLGIAGMKAILHKKFGYGIQPRRPLLSTEVSRVEPVLANAYVAQLMAMELELEKSSLGHERMDV